MKRLLIVEDKESLAQMLREVAEGEGFEPDVIANGAEAVRRLAEGRRYVVVLTDLRLPGADGIAVLRQSREMDPDCPVIVMTAFGTIEDAVEAMRIGAYDFVQKPVDVDYLTLLLRRCREHREIKFENLLLKQEFRERYGLPEIIGTSEMIVEVSHSIQKVAPTDATVLLQGESGTGKELFARAIHQLSRRRDRAFVAVNCAAIPETLIENELFGHEKGAFTGAVGRQIGRFELADGGTIFLDEVGELSPAVQSKILRVLQERRFERVGGVATIDVDVRVICATNRHLNDAVRTGAFREDLFFRINVFPVTIPPLRARRDDIAPIAAHFLHRFAREFAKPSLRLSDDAVAAMRSYDWPGNIRELENSIERAAILCDSDLIDPRDLGLGTSRAPEDMLREAVDLSGSLEQATERVRRIVERAKIAEALRTSANRNEAAEALGIAPRTLAAKARELGVESEGISQK